MKRCAEQQEECPDAQQQRAKRVQLLVLPSILPAEQHHAPARISPAASRRTRKRHDDEDEAPPQRRLKLWRSPVRLHRAGSLQQDGAGSPPAAPGDSATPPRRHVRSSRAQGGTGAFDSPQGPLEEEEDEEEQVHCSLRLQCDGRVQCDLLLLRLGGLQVGGDTPVHPQPHQRQVDTTKQHQQQQQQGPQPAIPGSSTAAAAARETPPSSTGQRASSSLRCNPVFGMAAANRMTSPSACGATTAMLPHLRGDDGEGGADGGEGEGKPCSSTGAAAATPQAGAHGRPPGDRALVPPTAGGAGNPGPTRQASIKTFLRTCTPYQPPDEPGLVRDHDSPHHAAHLSTSVPPPPTCLLPPGGFHDTPAPQPPAFPPYPDLPAQVAVPPSPSSFQPSSGQRLSPRTCLPTYEAPLSAAGSGTTGSAEAQQAGGEAVSTDGYGMDMLLER